MLNYVKMPRSVNDYTLMKGVTDYSNLKQFDLFESGYSFLTVVSTPKYMDMIKDDKVSRLRDGFTHILEGEFRGISGGIPDLTADPGSISNNINELQLINNVSMDTSIQVEMTFYERSGSLLTNYLNYYLTGIKDPYTKAKTYHGLIASGQVTDPGPDYEVFTFLYYVTDNTMRKIEKAYLLCNAQPAAAPNGQLYATEHGSYDFVQVGITFNCFPIVGDKVNKYAAMMLQNDLTTPDNNRKLILESDDYEWKAFSDKVESNESIVKDIINGDTTVIDNLYKI